MPLFGGGPSGGHLGQVVLSRLFPGQIDGGKDIFHSGLLGIKMHGKQVLLGVIGYFQDTPKSGDGGAHGVGATASHKTALLYQPRHPEMYPFIIHGEFSIYSVQPALRLHPARLALCMG